MYTYTVYIYIYIYGYVIIVCSCFICLFSCCVFYVCYYVYKLDCGVGFLFYLVCYCLFRHLVVVMLLIVYVCVFYVWCYYVY